MDRRATALSLALATLAALGTTRAQDPTGEGARPRTFRMGFAAMAPRPDVPLAIKVLGIWTARADAAVHHLSVPWAKLLAGADPEALLAKDPGELFQLYRAKKLATAVTIEPLDGLDRRAEAPALRAAGKSIRDPTVQALYVKFALAVSKVLRPDYLGLAAEVNLFAKLADGPAGRALVEMTREAARRLAEGTHPKLYVSVQVDFAWGKGDLRKPGDYEGADAVLRDYPFVEVLGLSTYPVFGWDDPDQLPRDYFSRLVKGRELPVILVEGGWSSASSRLFESSREKQARWVKRLEALLDDARAELAALLIFTDLETDRLVDLDAGHRETLRLFSSMGFVDAELRPKPALEAWDRIFARPRRRG